MSLVVLPYPACTGVIWSSVSSGWVCTFDVGREEWVVGRRYDVALYIPFNSFPSQPLLSSICKGLFSSLLFSPILAPQTVSTRLKKWGEKNTLSLQTVCMQGYCPDVTRARSQRQKQQRARREGSVHECMCEMWGF